MALALARKYRPRNFASVAVQSHVSNTLKGAIAHGRVAHGYLLCGPRGVGKTTLARVLAMALNCERRGDDGEPCGECSSCSRIWSGAASLDVIEIDAASNRGVDDARELRERAMYAPSGDERYKVYIVDEAHMLTREAWNALLKILEEPPPRVVFVFATTEPQKIAQTAAPVLSRLQRFDFKRMSVADIRERLTAVLAQEGVKAEPDALSTLARAADGSMRDALSLTDQVLSLGGTAVTVERVRDALGLVPEDEYLAILDIIAERRAADVFTAVGKLADAGIDFGTFLTGLADMLRAQLAVVLNGEPGGISERARAELEARRERLSAADLLRMLNALAELEPRFRKSGQQQLLLETLLVRFALLDRAIDLEDVLRGLGGDAGAGSSRGREPAPRPAPAAPRASPSRDADSARSGGVSRKAAAPGETAPGDWTRGESVRPAQPPEPRWSDDPFPREPRASYGGAAPAVAMAEPAAPAVAPGIATPLADGSVSVAPLADVSAGTPVAPPEVNTLVEKWDDVVERVRRAGRSTLAAALQHALPVAVTSRGVVTVELDQPNEIYAKAFETGRDEVAAAVRGEFAGVSRVILRAPADPSAAPPARLTEESLRAERLALIRKRDPALDAAVDALDLELLD